MDILEYLQNLIGENYGKVSSVCKGGSWLYTKEGKTKICIPKLEPKGKGQILDKNLSLDLLEEEVLFIETDKGLIVKDGNLYKFYKKENYTLRWKK